MPGRIALMVLALVLSDCHHQPAAVHPKTDSTASLGGTGAPMPPPAPHLTLAPAAWIDHLETQLMPFWMRATTAKSEKDPYPTFRCSDGKAFGEEGCDLAAGEYKALVDANAAVRKNGRPDGTKGDGPYEWLTGPNNELLNRTYIRMHSRETFGYGVAYHMTGKPEYLALAHRGVKWLLGSAIDKRNGSYTFVVEGKGLPEVDFRNSQDQSYTLLGLAFYYYLTRDEKILAILTDLKDQVKARYMSNDWEQGRLIRWMRKTRQEPQASCFSTIPEADKGTVEQKELVAILDQVNAYMLLTAITVPPAARNAWMADLHGMAETLRDRFYNDGIKSADQAHTGVSPEVPKGMFAGCLTYKGPPVPAPGTLFCVNGKNPPPLDPENCNPAFRHTDFGHSIKTFWMLYLVGREAKDAAMVKFAIDGADRLFPMAYLDNGSWGRALTKVRDFDPRAPRFETDRDKEWWISAELDQMAATMALRDPATHVARLNTTYQFWLKNFSPDGLEVIDWLYDDCKGSNDECPNRRYTKGNLWKGPFHTVEHALVAYITTAGVERTPAQLYFALVNPETPTLQPYYFHARTSTHDAGTADVEGTRFRIVRAEFSDIR